MGTPRLGWLFVTLIGVAACGGGDDSSADTGTITIDSSAMDDAGDAGDAAADAAGPAEGVGEACLPESVPSGGFLESEVFLETSTAACDTAICLVHQLDGIPFGSAGCATPAEARANADCASEADTVARVFCTCRCEAPSDPTAVLCTCPDGFECAELLSSGGAGVSGSYCVREGG